ncbi:MAG: HD domain-containing protein [Candidatus Manganitrophaceae bacterium]|nr:MAG: HD domain-containing protein [Candidatus Manganitrophaceae bacterium]
MPATTKKGKKAAVRKKDKKPAVQVRAEVGLKNKLAAQKARLQILETMEEIGRLLNSTLDEREVRKRAMESATRLMRSEVGSLLLIDPETQELFFEVALGEKGETIREIRLRPGEGIAGWVAQTGEPQIVNDTRANPHFFKSADEKSGFITRNMICVPVKIREKIVGVLQAINKKRGKFTPVDLEGFRSLADQVAIAIENAGLYKELKETFLSTAAALGDAIEAKDAYTGGHTKRVLEYSLVVGRRLELSQEELDQLKLAAALHDIGKIGIEDRILGKPNRLEPEEAQIMESHTVIGAKIVENIRPLRGIIPGIRHHHEKYDGKGYPDALKGGSIPIMARIISVCDTFDAITSDRPYRKGLHSDIALQELRRHAGTQFDPKAVDAFIAAFENGEIEPILYRNRPGPLFPSPSPEKAPS